MVKGFTGFWVYKGSTVFIKLTIVIVIKNNPIYFISVIRISIRLFYTPCRKTFAGIPKKFLSF